MLDNLSSVDTVRVHHLSTVGDRVVTYREGIVKNTEFFTTAELAEKLKMNVQVITRKVQAGEIAAYKLGKDWRIPEQSVFEWLERNANGNGDSRAARSNGHNGNGGNGKSRTVLTKRSTRAFLLEYILAQFEPSREYSEDEVNRVIARYHDDFDTVREEFLDNRMMSCARGKYARRPEYRLSD